MKIAIVGCGAMGSVYAGLLAAAGNEVWAVDIDKAHIDAMAKNGLQVSGASGERTVRLNATVNPADAGICDLVVIATKSMQVEAAAAAAKPLVGPKTIVVPIQNGLGSPERVSKMLPGAHVAIGVAGGFGASIPAPGKVHHNGWELLRFGEQTGPASSTLKAVADTWAAAGFKVRVFDDAGPMVWEKFICNVCYSATCALTGLTIGQVAADERAFAVALACAKEAYAVARAIGINLGFTDTEQYVQAFSRTIPNARPSMLLDHMARRRAEIDVINGAVPPLAKKHGLPAPTNDIVCNLLWARETTF